MTNNRGEGQTGNVRRVWARKEIGAIGERAAAEMLLESGYAVIERNWRCRTGELDIVAEGEGRIVFVEVRTRMSEGRFGTAAESVDYRKQRQVRETALFYLRAMKLADKALRFDVVAITLDKEGSVKQINHVKAAF